MTWTEATLYELIAKRYPAPACACFPQVANATGAGKQRSADAMVMSLWPSRGLTLHGFEIKVSRSDWTRELKNPAKAEIIASKCTEWWIVAPPDVVPPDQLPPTWGLLVPATKGPGPRASLKVVVHAVAREAVEPNRAFWAALLRAAHLAQERMVAGAVPREEVQRRVEEQVATQRESMDAQVKTMVARQTRQLQYLKDDVEAFEKASGLKLSEVRAADLGAAVRLAIKHQHRVEMVQKDLESRLQWTRKHVDQALLALEDQAVGS